MQRISIVDGELAYTEGGSGAPLVLIHGFPLDHSIWDTVATGLSARARVIRPDLRGLGVSSVTIGPYLMETLAGDIATLLDALRIERAAIVGHSLGGYVALAFFRMYRERVTALGLVGSGTGTVSAAAANGLEQLAQLAERDGIGPVVNQALPQLFAPATYTGDPALVAGTRALMERTAPAGAAALMRGMAMRVDSSDLLEDVSVPFLVARGVDDPLFGAAESRQTAGAVARGRYVEIPAAGHSPMLEAPDALGVAIGGLLDEG